MSIPNPIWIWWLFELFLIFLFDMSYFILATIVLWWVAKTGLSQRHRHNSLTQYRFKDQFFQDRFYEQRLRSEQLRQEQSYEDTYIPCSLSKQSKKS